MSDDSLMRRIMSGQGPILGRMRQQKYSGGPFMRRQGYQEDTVLYHLEREMSYYGETLNDIEAVVFAPSPYYHYVPENKQNVSLSAYEAKDILRRMPWFDVLDNRFNVWSKGYVYTVRDTDLGAIWIVLSRNPQPFPVWKND